MNILTKIYSRFDEHTQELVSGASIAFVLKIFAAVLGLALNIYLARTLGAGDAGLYFLSLTLVTILATLGRIGTDGALVRFISASDVNGNYSQIKHVYQYSLFLSSIFSLLLSIGLFFAAPYISNNIFNKPSLEIILKIMSFAVMPFALYMLHSFALQGLKKIREANIILGILVPMFTLIGCIILIPNNGVVGATVAYVLSAALVLFFGIYIWYKKMPKQVHISSVLEFSTFFKSSLPLFVVAIFNLLLAWNPSLLLGVWGSESDLGIFQITNRVAMLTSFVLIAVNSIFSPKLSACFAEANMELAQTLVNRSTALMLIFAIPILLLFVIFPSEILSAFGNDFREGKQLLVILAVGQLFNVATGSVGQILIMSGNEKKLQYAFIIASIVSVLASFLLIKEYGAFGAAISTVIGIFVVNILAVYFVVQNTSLKLFSWTKLLWN